MITLQGLKLEAHGFCRLAAASEGTFRGNSPIPIAAQVHLFER